MPNNNNSSIPLPHHLWPPTEPPFTLVSARVYIYVHFKVYINLHIYHTNNKKRIKSNKQIKSI